MKFPIWFQKKFVVNNWIGFGICGILTLAVFLLTVLAIKDFTTDDSIAKQVLIIISSAFGTYCGFSSLVHISMGLYPNIILDESHIVFRVVSKPFHKIIRKLPYTEIQLYPSIKSSEEAQKNCSVTKIGSINNQHGVAIRSTDEIFLIAVKDPFIFCKELSYRIEQELKSSQS